MDIIGRFLLRLLLIPLGCVVALSMAALVVLVANWADFAALAGAHTAAQEEWFFAFAIAGPAITFFLAVATAFSFAPAVIGILIAEVFAIRSWIYHVGNGGLSAWVGWTLMQNVPDEYLLLLNPKIMVAAGIAAGFGFWVVAGWTAGFLRPLSKAAQRYDSVHD